MFRRALLPIMAILIGSMILGSPPTADAAFKLRISTDGGTTFPIVVEDNMAGDNAPLVNGLILASFPLPGGGIVNFTISSNRTLNAPFGRISQTELAFAGGTDIDFGASVFVIDVTDTGYTLPAGPSILTSETSSTGFDGVGASEATVTFQSWADPANTEFAMGGITGGPQGPFVNTNFGGPNPPDTLMTLGSMTPPYSMTSRFIITDAFIPAAGSLELTGTARLAQTVVPEPATMVMLGMCAPVLGLGGLVRRFRSRKEA